MQQIPLAFFAMAKRSCKRTLKKAMQEKGEKTLKRILFLFFAKLLARIRSHKTLFAVIYYLDQ